MGMTRDQIRREARRMSREATLEKRKLQPPTKQEVSAWLSPVRKALGEMLRSGNVDTIKGYAVTKIGNDDDYSRVDWCINGFVAVLKRIDQSLDFSALEKVSSRLDKGVPLEEDLLKSALETLDIAEKSMMQKTLGSIYDAAITEQILIELEAGK